jgi:hypothetical protein
VTVTSVARRSCRPKEALRGAPLRSSVRRGEGEGSDVLVMATILLNAAAIPVRSLTAGQPRSAHTTSCGSSISSNSLASARPKHLIWPNRTQTSGRRAIWSRPAAPRLSRSRSCSSHVRADEPVEDQCVHSAGGTQGVEVAEQAASAKDPTRRRMAKGMERLHVYMAGPPDADQYRQHASELLRRAGHVPIDPMRRDFRGPHHRSRGGDRRRRPCRRRLPRRGPRRLLGAGRRDGDGGLVRPLRR